MANCAIFCEVTLLLLFIIPYATSNTGNRGSSKLHQKSSIANWLLSELGTHPEHHNSTEESHYDSDRCLKVCLKDVTFIKEFTGSGEKKSWREYLVEFVLPCDKGNTPKQNTPIRTYSVIAKENTAMTLDFEVILETPDYTISKYEEMECRNGTLVSKSYHNWTKEGGQAVTVKLRDYEYLTTEEEEKKENEPTLRSLPMFGNPLEGFQPVTERFEKDVDATTINQPVDVETTTNIPTTTMKDNEGDGKDQFVELQPNRSSDERPNASNWFQSNENATNGSNAAFNPCSPVLVQLLAGNGLLPGLCNLRKGEQIVLRGDIVISKRYKDGNSTKDRVEPLFVIHENTEIENPN